MQAEHDPTSGGAAGGPGAAWVVRAFDAAPSPRLLCTSPDDLVVAANAAAVDRWPLLDGGRARLSDLMPGLPAVRLLAARAGGRARWPLPGARAGEEETVVTVEITRVRGLGERHEGPGGVGAAVLDVRLEERPDGPDDVHEVDEEAVVPGLQEAHLPRAVPVLPGLEVAARYVVAESGDGAGGGWFDAVPLGPGCAALVVGDVLGRDLAAIAVMSQLRAALTAALHDGSSPAEAIEALDRFAGAVEGAAGASACVVEVDARRGLLRWCAAGHRGPVLVLDGGAAPLAGHLPGGGAPALGSGARYEVSTGVMPEGAVLLLASGSADLPVARASPTAGLDPVPGDAAMLARAAVDALAVDAPSRRGVLEPAVNRVLEALLTEDALPEDLALVGAARVPEHPPLDIGSPPVPGAVRRLREALGAWLADLEPSRWDDSVLRLAVTELVGNAVVHGRRESDREGDLDAAPVRLEARLDDRGAVVLSVHDAGRWREPGPGAAGRGLPAVRGLVDELAVDRRRTGTSVTVVQRLRRDAPVYRASVPRPRGAEDGPRVSARWDDRGTLHVRGSVDSLDAEELRALLLGATCGGVRDVVVDVTALERLGREGVQVLAEARGWRERDGGRLDVVAGPASAAHWALETAGLAHA